MANIIENLTPLSASLIYLNLGRAHFEKGREGGMEEATLYYQKAIEMAKKAGDNRNLSDGVLSLSQCYVKMGRGQEAMDLYMGLCDEIFSVTRRKPMLRSRHTWTRQTVQLGPSHCQKCRQICAKDAIMEKCSVCKVDTAAKPTV